MKKIIITISLILQASLYSQIEITGKDKDTIINNAIKINNHIGYKGDVSITVEFHNEEYSGVKGGSKNVGKIYKAYFDLVNTNSQKILLYADKDKGLKELEMTYIDEEFKIVYGGKDITDNVSRYEKELSRYPYSIIACYLNYGTDSFDILMLDISFASYFGLMKYKGNNLYKGEQDEDNPYSINLEEYFDGTPSGIGLADDFHIIQFFVDENSKIYSWIGDFISDLYIRSMAEGLSITFLDKNGWVKK